MARLKLNTGVYLGYDHVENAFRTSPKQAYQVWFDKPETWGTLLLESIAAAKRIRESTDKEIVVVYSGGLDSEWPLEAFRLAGIEVTALFISYKNGLNDHDAYWAKRYLERTEHKSIIWHELDLEEWYKSDEQKELAWTVQTPELAYTAQFKSILDNRNDSRVFITGYDEPLIVANDQGSERIWELTYSERHYSVVKFFEAFNVDGCSNWSRQSAELFAAYVTQPQWKMLAANLYEPVTWNSELVKIPMYQQSFPFLEARPKYTGFEKSLSFIVSASNSWKEYVESRTDCKWLEEYRENIHDVWRKLGVTPR